LCVARKQEAAGANNMTLTLAASIQNIDIGSRADDCGDNDEMMMMPPTPQRRPINISNNESFRTKRRTVTASNRPTITTSCCCSSNEEDLLPVLKRGKSEDTLSTACSSMVTDPLEDVAPLSPPRPRRRPLRPLQPRGVHFESDSCLATVVGHVAHRSDLTCFEKDALYWSNTDLRLIRQDAKAISKYYRSPNGRRAMYELDRVYTWTMTNTTAAPANPNSVEGTLEDDDEEDFLTESYWDEFLYNETNQMDRYAVPLLWHWSGCRASYSNGPQNCNGTNAHTTTTTVDEAGRGLERYCSLRQRLERTQFTNHVRQTVIALYHQLKPSLSNENDHGKNNHCTNDRTASCVAAAYRRAARPAVLFARILGHADELAAEQAVEMSLYSSSHNACATTAPTHFFQSLPKELEIQSCFNDPLPASLEPTPLHPSCWGSPTDYSIENGRENASPIPPTTIQPRRPHSRSIKCKL
jgi:hypothetical protein